MIFYHIWKGVVQMKQATEFLDKIQLNAISAKLERFEHSSMRYIDIEESAHMSLVHESDELILLLEQSVEPHEIHFATNCFDKLVKMIGEEAITGQIKFVPKPFDHALMKHGFKTHSEFQDFFNRHLQTTAECLDVIGPMAYATKDDSIILSKVSKSCSGYSRGFYGDDAEWFESWFDEGNTVLVHRENDEIVGICCLSIYSEGTTLWIRDLAVDPRFHRKGIGRKLFEQALMFGAKQNAEKAFLATDVTNVHAIKLYESYGFMAKEGAYELQMTNWI